METTDTVQHCSSAWSTGNPFGKKADRAQSKYQELFADSNFRCCRRLIIYCNEGGRLFSFRQTCSKRRGAYKLPATSQQLHAVCWSAAAAAWVSDGDTCSIYHNITNFHKKNRRQTNVDEVYTEKNADELGSSRGPCLAASRAVSSWPRSPLRSVQ